VGLTLRRYPGSLRLRLANRQFIPNRVDPRLQLEQAFHHPLIGLASHRASEHDLTILDRDLCTPQPFWEWHSSQSRLELGGNVAHAFLADLDVGSNGRAKGTLALGLTLIAAA
jgi:hypothetical protein